MGYKGARRDHESAERSSLRQIKKGLQLLSELQPNFHICT